MEFRRNIHGVINQFGICQLAGHRPYRRKSIYHNVTRGDDSLPFEYLEAEIVEVSQLCEFQHGVEDHKITNVNRKWYVSGMNGEEEDRSHRWMDEIGFRPLHRLI